MLHFELMAVVVLAVTIDCQVVFPSSGNNKQSASSGIHKTCTASNGKSGLCYEFRSAEFKECSSFYPSLDSSNPKVADHLNENKCKNDGKEIYFCCPDSPALDDVIPKESFCGTSFRDFVVGGNVTQAGDWPWLANIGSNFAGFYQSCCGGTLITKQHVISAAHCFTPSAKKKCPGAFVRLGEYDTNDDNDGAQDYNIIKEIAHDYDTTTKENDLILLKLDRPIDSITDSIVPVCLPYHLRSENFIQKDVIVVGWGRFSNRDRRPSPVPLEASVPVVPISECQEKYTASRSDKKVDDRQLCAGTGGADSCNGDSGGPLNYLDSNKGKFYIVGVVSFGPRICGTDQIPGVYARIASYLDWIEENLIYML